MSTRLILTLCASAAVLTACATKQQNPIYKYSSKYNTSTPYSTVANNAGSTATAGAYQTAGQVVSDPFASAQGAAYPTSDYTSASQIMQNAPQTQNVVTYANSASENSGYMIPAASEPTRTLKKCAISGGVETCQLVEVPVSALQTSSAPSTYPQGSYLTAASTAQSSGRLTQVESECVQAGAVVPCFPVEKPIAQSSATISQPYYTESQTIVANSYSAPVQTPNDTLYSDTVGGTPGFYAVNGGPPVSNSYVSAPTSAPAVTAQYAEPTYVDVLPDVDSYTFTRVEEPAPHSQSRVVSAATAQTSPIFENSYISGTGTLHTVSKGDTVYSMSRASCVSIEEFRSMNSIKADNYIRLGDTIRLPASRC